MIDVRGLAKHYQVHRRPPGLGAALRSVFRRSYDTVRAVDGIDFSVGEGERVGFRRTGDKWESRKGSSHWRHSGNH